MHDEQDLAPSRRPDRSERSAGTVQPAQPPPRPLLIANVHSGDFGMWLRRYMDLLRERRYRFAADYVVPRDVLPYREKQVTGLVTVSACEYGPRSRGLMRFWSLDGTCPDDGRNLGRILFVAVPKAGPPFDVRFETFDCTVASPSFVVELLREMADHFPETRERVNRLLKAGVPHHNGDATPVGSRSHADSADDVGTNPCPEGTRAVHVPQRPADYERWCEIWAAIECHARNHLSTAAIQGYLQQTELTAHHQTLRRIIRAGLAGRLKPVRG